MLQQMSVAYLDPLGRLIDGSPDHGIKQVPKPGVGYSASARSIFPMFLPWTRRVQRWIR